MKKDFLSSLWEDVTLPNFEQLNSSKEADICVIGGGISGLTTAYKLAQRGCKVMLLEGATLASGQTGRTTGHLTCQLETEFYRLKDFFSTEDIQGYIKAHRRGIEVIKKIIEFENIDCDFKEVEGFLFSNKKDETNELKKEKEAAIECGLRLELKQTPYLKHDKLGLKFPQQAQFHPLKYIAGLIQALRKYNVEIYENTRVDKVKEANGVAEVTTSDGKIINCNYVVVATDTPINDRFKIHTKQHAYRTYVLAFKKLKEMPEDLVWDTDDPYHYIRSQGDYLIVGGADHKTGQHPKHDPFEQIEIWARDNIEELGIVAAKWSGQVFEPIDQMAYIGRNSEKEPHIMIITGASGIGLTTASFGAEIIRDLITQGSHPQEDLFSPNRKNFKCALDYTKENLNTAIQYVDWITPAEGEDAKVPKKCRACPHLGGLTHWNEKEHTWDCPTHGSRFNEEGKVIEGPAHRDLDLSENP